MTSPTVSASLKDIKNTKFLIALSLVVAAFYIVFDLFSGAYGYIWVYNILIVAGLSGLLLIKYGYLLVAKCLVITGAYAVITIFASVETLETGIYFYYLVLTLGAFTLFGYHYMWIAISYSFLSMGCFFFVFFTDYKFIDEVALTDEYVRSSLFVNFIVITFSTSAMIFYLLKNNHKAESTLKLQQADLVRTTEELELSKRRFELAIQGSSAAIWDWDIKSDHITTTPKLAEIMERPYEKIKNATHEAFFEVVHPDDTGRLRLALERHLEIHQPFEVEIRVRKASGDYVWILDTGQAEWDRNGKPVRMVGTIVDIHDKKLAVERVKEQNIMLAKANEELDRFVYSTSHDLRAPLSSLLGLINLAGLSTKKKERDSLIGMMQTQITKLDSYIQDITDYSRNTRVDIEPTTFNLKEVVDESIVNLKYMEGADHIDIKCEVDASYTIYTDKERFKIILNNLISNAIKYQNLEKDSTLQIYCRSSSQDSYLVFEDNGIGIKKQHLNKVFDMFYRASDKSRGSGLGLYIAKEIAEKINTELSVKSTYGEGTTFTVGLPSENKLA